jgi:DNA-binding CsgD family transcriptional regulator
MFQEVGSPILQLLLAACQEAKLPRAALLEGLNFRPEAMGNPGARLDWEDLTLILDRILAAAGNEARFVALMAEGPRLLVPNSQCETLFPDFQTFFVWMVSSLPALLHHNLQTSTRILGSGRILCEHYIPQPYRPCRALALASVGIFRGAPRVFRQPDALVDCSFDGRCGLYRITLPCQSLGPAGSRAQKDEFRIALVEAERAASYLLDGVNHSSWFTRLGQSLLAAPDLMELSSQLQEGLSFFAGCRSGSLWVLDAEGDMVCLRTWGNGTGTPQIRMLTVGTRVIGRVELPAEANLTPEEQQTVQDMLAWASIPIDRLLEAAKKSSAREVNDSFLEGLDLTSRQKEVLFLLVQGLSDKEIAQTVGTSPKTIGHQVGVLLRKGGVSCRTALANLCLTGHSASSVCLAKEALVRPRALPKVDGKVKTG